MLKRFLLLFTITFAFTSASHDWNGGGLRKGSPFKIPNVNGETQRRIRFLRKWHGIILKFKPTSRGHGGGGLRKGSPDIQEPRMDEETQSIRSLPKKPPPTCASEGKPAVSCGSNGKNKPASCCDPLICDPTGSPTCVTPPTTTTTSTTTTPPTTTSTTSTAPPTTTTTSSTTTAPPTTTTTSTTTSSTTPPTTTTTSTTTTPPPTCPGQHCSSATVTTMNPVACDSTGVQATRLDTFSYANGDVLIELWGPNITADPNIMAAVVFPVSHGGSFEPNYISDRSYGVMTKDLYTEEMGMLMIDKFIQNYCKVPYVIINRLHRRKLDANREIGEAAQGDPIAEDAWWAFHNFIKRAQEEVRTQMGTVTNSKGVVGVPGLLFDLHGYFGSDWDSSDGGQFIHWGYRLSATSTLGAYCPIDDKPGDTIGTYTHARDIPNPSYQHGYECLVRGPGSLGARVSAVPVGGVLGICGDGLPSYNHPYPYEVATDSVYCEKWADDGESCHYFTGGYDVERHEHLNWENLSGDKMNAVQAETPSCIRYNAVPRETMADQYSIAICSFLRDLFGASAGTC